MQNLRFRLLLNEGLLVSVEIRVLVGELFDVLVVELLPSQFIGFTFFHSYNNTLLMEVPCRTKNVNKHYKVVLLIQ